MRNILWECFDILVNKDLYLSVCWLALVLVKYSPQVLQTTKASSVAAELRICEIFNRYYSELCQKSKLPDSGESSLNAWNQGLVEHRKDNDLTEAVKKNLTFVIVLGKIYELLGVLAEVHPSEMVNNSEKLYKAYLGELKEQVCLQNMWEWLKKNKRRSPSYGLWAKSHLNRYGFLNT